MFCVRSLIGQSAVALLLVSVFALAGPAAFASVGDYKCTDCDKVYFGNARLFKKPCVISADKVYRHIKEYKEILDKGLTDKDVRYHFLMKKASKRFNEAVKQMARDLDHDLVAETGTVKAAKKDAKDPPDRTDEVIKNLN